MIGGIFRLEYKHVLGYEGDYIQLVEERIYVYLQEYEHAIGC